MLGRGGRALRSPSTLSARPGTGTWVHEEKVVGGGADAELASVPSVTERLEAWPVLLTIKQARPAVDALSGDDCTSAESMAQAQARNDSDESLRLIT